MQAPPNKDQFNKAAPDEKWAIRYGTVAVDYQRFNPFDFKENLPESLQFIADLLESFIPPKFLTGIMGKVAPANHGYVEIGQVIDGQFVPEKRLQAASFGSSENGKIAPTGTGKLTPMIIDGDLTTFKDDPFQRDQGHKTLANQLQSADDPDHTQIVLQGSKHEMMEHYAMMLERANEISALGADYDILNRNCNTTVAELLEGTNGLAEKFNPKGWDAGFSPDVLDTKAKTQHWESSVELEQHIKEQEQIARGHLETRTAEMHAEAGFDPNNVIPIQAAEAKDTLQAPAA